MRIFQRYEFCIEKDVVPFSKAYEQVEAFLNSKQLKFENNIYRFYDYLHDFSIVPSAKLSKKFENQLNDSAIGKDNAGEYFFISNYDLKWHPIKEDDCKEITKLISAKVPRPYNCFETFIGFSNINFFNRYTAQMFLDENIICDKQDFPLSTPLSNNIILYKFCLSGRVWSLKLTIDVTNNEDKNCILDSSQYVDGICQFFHTTPAKPIIIVGLNNEEKAKYQAIGDIVEKIVDNARNAVATWEGSPQILSQKPQDDLAGAQYSLVKPLKKAVKQTGYEYWRYDYCVYYLRKTDEFNHKIYVDIITAPHCRRIDIAIRYLGLGFSYTFGFFTIPLSGSFTPRDQKQAELYIECLFAMLANLENKYLHQIGEAYPQTPNWYPY